MTKKIDIGGELHSVATDHKVADASEIKDISKGNKSQAAFNDDVDRHEVEIHGTGGIVSRLTDVEQIEQIVLDGGEAQIAQGSDFTNPDATKRAKIPTVGAIVDGLNDGVYDVSKRNPTAGPNSDGKFTLDYILDNANILIPTSWRHGGMIISFVHSSDNKYVQYFLTKNTWSVSEGDWQKMNLEEEVSQLGQETIRLIVIGGKYIDYSGDEIENSDWGCTEFIMLNGVTTLKWKSGQASSVGKLALYDASKEFIGYWSTTSVDERVIDISSYTSAVYVRASFYLSSQTGYYLRDADDRALNTKTIKDTDAVATENSTNLIESNAVYQEGKRVENLALQAVNGVDVKVQKNKANFDGETLLRAIFSVGSLNASGAEIINNVRIRSNYIDVIYGGKVLLSVLDLAFVINGVYLYDKNKTFIRELSFTAGQDTELQLTYDTAFVRITMRSNPDGWNFSTGGIPDKVYYSFKLQQESLRNINLYNILSLLQKCGRINRNYVPGYYIDYDGHLVPATGVNVSKLIPIVGTTFTWNFGTTAYTNTWKVCVFDAFLNLLEYWTITGGNTRTIDFSNREYAANAKYIVASFGDDFANASIVQGANTWKPSEENVPQNIIEYLDVCTYNVGAYRRNAAYMSEEDKEGFLRQLKGFMNGKINKDILFTQEEVNSFTDGFDTINTYETYYRQFYPYKYICRNGWSCIYSKYPLKNCRVFDYTFTPSGGTEQHRYYALAEIEINGKLIGLASVHFYWDAAMHQDEFNAIIAEMAQYEYAIIAGDFNLSNSEAPQSEKGNCPIIDDTFGMAGYQSANWEYWGNIHTQTDVDAEGHVVAENQIDSFITKGFAINSFDVLPVEYYDHMPCVSMLNFI